MLRWRGSLLSAGSGMKSALGAVLIVVGALILTGMDKPVEAAL